MLSGTDVGISPMRPKALASRINPHASVCHHGTPLTRPGKLQGPLVAMTCLDVDMVGVASTPATLFREAFHGEENSHASHG
jgi:hypothetical protein